MFKSRLDPEKSSRQRVSNPGSLEADALTMTAVFGARCQCVVIREIKLSLTSVESCLLLLLLFLFLDRSTSQHTKCIPTHF